jgi:hypothetical protein
MRITRPKGIAMSWVKSHNEGDGKGLLSPSPSGEGEMGTGQPNIALCGVFQVSNRINLVDENWGMSNIAAK